MYTLDELTPQYQCTNEFRTFPIFAACKKLHLFLQDKLIFFQTRKYSSRDSLFPRNIFLQYILRTLSMRAYTVLFQITAPLFENNVVFFLPQTQSTFSIENSSILIKYQDPWECQSLGLEIIIVTIIICLCIIYIQTTEICGK